MISNPVTSIIGILIAVCPLLASVFPDLKALCDTSMQVLIGAGFVASADGIRQQKRDAPSTDGIKTIILMVLILSATACSTANNALKSLSNGFCQATTLCKATDAPKPIQEPA